MHRHSLLLIAPQQLHWQEEALPPLAPDELLLKTLVGAISVGTELPLYRGTHRGSHPIGYPIMSGYESLAEVIACGSAVRHVSRGERVIAFYGHRTAAVLPARRVIPVPDDISNRLALLAILSCDVAKGIAKVDIQPQERILLTGAGTIGLLTVFNLSASGVARVDVVEPLAKRRDLASQFGASSTITPQKAQSTLLSSEEGYHVGFECSSRHAAFALLQQKLLHAGRLCILADGNLEPLILTPAFHEKELNIMGSSDGLDYPGHAKWWFEQVRHTSAPLEALFELETDAEHLAETFAKMATEEHPPIKVLVRYEHTR